MNKSEYKQLLQSLEPDDQELEVTELEDLVEYKEITNIYAQAA